MRTLALRLRPFLGALLALTLFSPAGCSRSGGGGGGSGSTLTIPVTYTYDAEGNRLSLSIGTPSSTTTYPSVYFNTDGTKQTRHIFVNGRPIATVESGPAASHHFWNYTDHLGSTRIMTDADGQIAESVDYRPFGKQIPLQSNAHEEQRKFTGHEFDKATEYTYAQARYLDTTLGRFLSEDQVFLAIGDTGLSRKTQGSAFDTVISNVDEREALEAFLKDPQALNSYSYGLNNPLKYVDREGEVVQFAGVALAVIARGTIFGAVGGIVGTAIATGGHASPRDYALAGLKGGAVGAAGSISLLAAAALEIGGGAIRARRRGDINELVYGVRDAGVTLVFGGLFKTLPQVRGSDISVFSSRIVTSVHSQREAVQTLTTTVGEVGVQKAQAYVVQQLQKILLQLQSIINLLEQYGKKTP